MGSGAGEKNFGGSPARADLKKNLCTRFLLMCLKKKPPNNP